MAQAKFKKGNKVRISYERKNDYEVAEIKATTYFEYLVEAKDGSRRWVSQENLRLSKSKGK